MRSSLALLASLFLLCCTASHPAAVPAEPAPPQAPEARAEPEPTEDKLPGPGFTLVGGSPLIVVAELPAVSRVFPIDGALFVAAQEPLYEDIEKPPRDGAPVMYGREWYPIGLWKNDKLEYLKSLELQGGSQIISDIQGKWPDAVDLVATGSNGRTAIAEYFRLSDKGWWYSGKLCNGSPCLNSVHLGLQQYRGSTITLTFNPMALSPPRFDVLRGPPQSLSFAAYDKNCPSTAMFHSEFGARVMPRVFGSLRDGTLISFGFDCNNNPAFESWGPAGGASRVVIFEENKGFETLRHEHRFLRGPGNSAWILGGDIFEFDGSVWKRIDGPLGRPISLGASAPDGTLWVASEDALYRRAGAWEKHLLPQGFSEINDMAIDLEGTLWVTSGNALLRSRRRGEAAPDVAIKKAVSARKKKTQWVRPGGRFCAKNVVALYAFTRVTPPEYDFPLTRKALRGHLEFEGTRFVVVQDGGNKFFSALVPSYEVGQKLVKLIEKEVKDSKPQVFCAEPEVQRELKINLKTGEVAK